MTENAGERLFLAIGQISDVMILEAERERLDVNEADRQTVSAAAQEPDLRTKRGADTDANANENEKKYRNGNTGSSSNGAADKTADAAKTTNADKKANTDKKANADKKIMNPGRYLKYLPVAACLCIVLGSASYIIRGFMQPKSSDSMSIRSGFHQNTDQNTDQSDGQKSDSSDNGVELAMDADGSAQSAAAQDEAASGSVQGGESGFMQQLPVCYDAYEGPVFPLTATGDTQKLKVSRNLKGIVATDDDADDIRPYLRVTDVYKIKNTSGHDKTLQLVYPFAATMNAASGTNGEILKVEGIPKSGQTDVSYSLGESVLSYQNADSSKTSTMADYQQIFNEQTDYQEQALAKEADWNQKVTVYTFSDIGMREETADTNQPAVFGVTIKGKDANVLTYGFDHSFANDDGSSNHCFFISEEQKKRVLIVTGEQEGDPIPACYTNLDCEERIDGNDYEMTGQEMTYAEALRLCSNDAARKLRQDYERGLFAAELPFYMNEDAAFRVLTIISEEERFYDTLMQRYQSVELSEIFERLFGETRVVYARATVTIPAKRTVRVTVQVQKRYKKTMDAGEGEQETEKQMQYDFFPGTQSHLKITKTSVLLQLKDAWQLTGQNLGLLEKRKQIWKTDALNQAGFVIVKYGKMQDSMDES